VKTPAGAGQLATDAGASRGKAGFLFAWAAILLAALVWRLLGITSTEVWRDEAITIIHTRATWLDLLTRLPWVEDTPPLVFMQFKAWSLICDREWFLRLLPVLWGTAWVHVVMVAARRLHPRAWWPAGLLAAFSQMPIHYSQEIRIYSFLLLVTALCLWAAERCVQAPRPRPWLYAVAGLLVLATHAHAVGLLFAPGVLVYLAGRFGPRRWREMAAWGPAILLVAGTLPMLWFARHWTAIRMAEGDWWVPPIDSWGVATMARRFLGASLATDWALSHVAAWKTWASFVAERLLLMGPVLLLALGIAHKCSRSRVIYLALCGLVFLAMLQVSSMVGLPNILDRTVLPVCTPLVLLLGVGAASVQNRRLSHLVHGLVVGMAAVCAGGWGWNIATTPQRPQSRELFAWLSPQIGPNDLIYTTPRWFKDLTVYRLENVISADQLLDPYEEYQGKPPRHRLVRQSPEGWRHRFNEKFERSRARAGANFNVWFVEFGLAPCEPGSPKEYITSLGPEFAHRDIFSAKSLSITGYRPDGSNPPASPTSSVGP
jgi:hypothetical protein